MPTQTTWAQRGKMLEYQKNGRTIECKTVSNHARVGQILVLDHVSYGEKSTDPLAEYPMKSVFIVEENLPRQTYENQFFLLQDKDGNFLVDETTYLYDLDEWLAWQIGHYEEKIRRKDHKIELQQAQIDILKNALNQNVKVVTEAQAKQLGIK